LRERRGLIQIRDVDARETESDSENENRSDEKLLLLPWKFVLQSESNRGQYETGNDNGPCREEQRPGPDTDNETGDERKKHENL
jgi:hypothetical protein